MNGKYLLAITSTSSLKNENGLEQPSNCCFSELTGPRFTYLQMLSFWECFMLEIQTEFFQQLEKAVYFSDQNLEFGSKEKFKGIVYV